jgi:hypothetical protein
MSVVLFYPYLPSRIQIVSNDKTNIKITPKHKADTYIANQILSPPFYCKRLLLSVLFSINKINVKEFVIIENYPLESKNIKMYQCLKSLNF